MPNGAPLRVLFVCTANQCRSPLAAALANQRAVELDINMIATSAGFRPGGHPAAEGSVRQGRKRGVDLSLHLSRTLEADIVNGTDVILTMEASHRRDVLEQYPDAARRTFTLAEAASLARSVGPLGRVDAWAERAHDRRPSGELLGSFRSDDIADPIGRGALHYSRMGSILADHITALMAPAGDSSPTRTHTSRWSDRSIVRKPPPTAGTV